MFQKIGNSLAFAYGQIFLPIFAFCADEVGGFETAGGIDQVGAKAPLQLIDGLGVVMLHVILMIGSKAVFSVY